MRYLCPDCRAELLVEGARLSCPACGKSHASIENGLVQFDGCRDKESFFEKQAVERLDSFYAGYSPKKFQEVLTQQVLWEMDWANKRVGITRKFWWEPHIGKVEGKKILEVGCGVNYIVPYFLGCQNSVFAFDICRESVEYSKTVVSRSGVSADKLRLAVADATRLELGEKFDIVDVNNVLHHIDDKPAVFQRIHRVLKDDGRLIIVEPNYYYPPRWMIETDVLDPFNFVKEYFVRNSLIEKGEKAIVFPRLLKQLKDAGFKIEKYFPDDNYLGYFTVYWVRERTFLAKLIFQLDKYLLRHLLPNAIAPFHYIVASKA